MNEEKTENPDAKNDGKIDWGEKGILGFLITGGAVAAFVGSNLYVMGLSITFHESIATYFDVFDYIQVTPAWAVPALVGSSVVFILIALCAFLAQFIALKPAENNAKEERKNSDKSVPRSPVSFWPVFLPLFLFLFSIYLLFIPEAQTEWGALIARFSFVVGTSAIAAFATQGVGIVFRYPRAVASAPWWTSIASIIEGRFFPAMRTSEPDASPDNQEKKDKDFTKRLASKQLGILRRCIPYVMGALCFAFLYGALVAPVLIKMGSETTVYLSEKKESKLVGRIVFRLSHSLILLSHERNRPLLLVPTDKIKLVKTPKARYTSSPTPSPSAQNSG